MVARGCWSLDQADNGRAVGRAVDQARGQMAGHQRARHQRPPEFLEDEDGFWQAETDPAGRLGQTQVEHPGFAEFAPTFLVDDLLGTLGRP